jgi:hypothetical protein
MKETGLVAKLLKKSVNLFISSLNQHLVCSLCLPTYKELKGYLVLKYQ